MKTIKFYFFSLKILLACLLLYNGQVVKAQDSQVHVDKDSKKYAWQIVTNNPDDASKPCQGCATFYYQVERSKTSDSEGYFTYYVYFWSQSSLDDGSIAGTYLNKPRVKTSDTQVEIVEKEYILVTPKDKYMMCKLKSTSPDLTVDVSWDSFHVY